MTSQNPKNQQIQDLLQKYGQSGLETAKETIKQKKLPKLVKEALEYFIEETWPNTHHPALIALCCHAVGGKPEKTNKLGAAIVLLTGAADIHDDIIDQSKIKGQRKTVYGKFNKEIVLLAGDALLFEGLFLLHNACKGLSKDKQQAILNSVEEAFLKIGNAIAMERYLKNRTINAKKYQKILETKGAVSEACAEIGALFGNGNPAEVKVLRDYGSILGSLMTIKNEFSDMCDANELINRLKNEILPLPILYAFEDLSKKREILGFLKGKLTKSKIQKISGLTLEDSQVQELKRQMVKKVNGKKSSLELVKNKEELYLILESSLTGLY